MAVILGCSLFSSVVVVPSDRHMYVWQRWPQFALCTLKRGDAQRPRNGADKTKELCRQLQVGFVILTRRRVNVMVMHCGMPQWCQNGS